jgi:hypothetical protein
MAKEIYEILGRPVTKEQYEAASKMMDMMRAIGEAPKDMKWIDFDKVGKRVGQSKEISSVKPKTRAV